MSELGNHQGLLTKEIFWNAIRQYLKEQEESDNSYSRQISQKEKVLSVLFGPSMWRDEALNQHVENFVNKDSNLYAYTFFLCSNTQFKYNWSYLLNKIGPITDSGTYAHTILTFWRFVDSMIEDVNYFLKNIRCRTSSLTFRINQFIKIRREDSNDFHVEIELKDLSKGVKSVSDNGYSMTVYLDQTILGVYNRTNKGNAGNRSEIAAAIERAIEQWDIK